MEKIPTAEEFLQTKYPMQDKDVVTRFSKDLIEYARLHVAAALKAASEKVKIEEYLEGDAMWGKVITAIDKKSIFTAYPLDKIT